MKICGEAIAVPELREFPNLIKRQDLSAFEVVSFAPFVDPFFRPEEQHGGSGEDEVIVPAGERQREVDE